MVTTKIKFTATDNMLSYHDNPTWEDGDVRDVEPDRAKDMVKSFSKNFAFADAKKEAPEKPEGSDSPDFSEPSDEDSSDSSDKTDEKKKSVKDARNKAIK